MSKERNCLLHDHTTICHCFYISSHGIWRGHDAWVSEADVRPRQKDFLLRLFPAKSIPHPIHLPENYPNYTHWVHRHTRTNFALSLPPLSFLPSLNLPQTLTEASREKAQALICFLCDSGLSDQGAVCLQANQILRRPETKSKHTEVPFQIHLLNGRAVP